MGLPRLPRHIAFSSLLFLTLSSSLGCQQGEGEQRASATRAQRSVAAVRRTQQGNRLTERGIDALCERRFPATGAEQRPFRLPPLRPLPGVTRAQPFPQSGWRWVNLWATWCRPCIEEFEMMRRWLTALEAEQLAPTLVLVSVDADQHAARLQEMAPTLPGINWWLRAPQLLGELLQIFDLREGAPIPIHAFIDPAGMIRCVRVGKLSPLDLPAIKALLQGKGRGYALP